MEVRSFASGYDKQFLCSSHQDDNNRKNNAFVIALFGELKLAKSSNESRDVGDCLMKCNTFHMKISFS